MTAILAMVLATALPGEKPDNPLQEFGALMVGRWVGDVTLIADWPGFGKKGDKVIGHFTVRWIADRKGLEDEGFSGQGTGKNIYFWDPGSKRIRQFGVDSGGTTGEYEFWKDGTNWAFKGSGFLADGSRVEGQGAIRVSDGGNTITFEGKFTVGGKPALDLKDVYKRASK
jgi:hypothetical protein